jgi:hypothetical protein
LAVEEAGMNSRRDECREEGSNAVSDTTRPSKQTREAEAHEARAPHEADRPATPEEEELADEMANDPESIRAQGEVGEHLREMAERGAAAEGEGRIP